MKKNSALFCPSACLCLVTHRLKHYLRFCCGLQCGDWHSVTVAYRPLVQVSHWAEWQVLWNNSDCLDLHCQHIHLSVSWFHQGRHAPYDGQLLGWFPQQACFMSFTVNEVFLPFGAPHWSFLPWLDAERKNSVMLKMQSLLSLIYFIALSSEHTVTWLGRQFHLLLSCLFYFFAK